MENRRTHAAQRALIAALVIAAGCQAPERAQRSDRPVAAMAPYFGITQTRTKDAAQYVVCAGPSCPVPTPKTAAHALSLSTTQERIRTAISQEAPTHAKRIDIPFAFNGMRMQCSDRLRLRAALSATTPAAVTIIGRSDATGTPAAKLKVAQARAAAVRAEVLAARPGAAVTVQHEIATVTTNKTSSRAHQRRATVHITTSSHQP